MWQVCNSCDHDIMLNPNPKYKRNKNKIGKGKIK